VLSGRPYTVASHVRHSTLCARPRARGSFVDLAGDERVPVRYLAPSAADMPIFTILLSGHVGCVLLRQTLRHDDVREPPTSQL
jgi:hypothetical protein